LLLVPLARPEPASAAAPTAPPPPEPSGGAAEPGAFALAFRSLAGDPQARQVSAAFMLAAAGATCLESLFYWVLITTVAGGNGFVQLLANLALWINGASLILSAGGASRIIRKLGIGTAVIAVPACLLLGSSYLLVATALII